MFTQKDKDTLLSSLVDVKEAMINVPLENRSEVMRTTFKTTYDSISKHINNIDNFSKEGQDFREKILKQYITDVAVDCNVNENIEDYYSYLTNLHCYLDIDLELGYEGGVTETVLECHIEMFEAISNKFYFLTQNNQKYSEILLIIADIQSYIYSLLSNIKESYDKIQTEINNKEVK
jgi:hypothetical protein